MSEPLYQDIDDPEQFGKSDHGQMMLQTLVQTGWIGVDRVQDLSEDQLRFIRSALERREELLTS